MVSVGEEFEPDPGYGSVAEIKEEFDLAVSGTSDALFKFVFRPTPHRLSETVDAFTNHIEVFRRAVGTIFSVDDSLEARLRILEQFVSKQDYQRREGPLKEIIGKGVDGNPREPLHIWKVDATPEGSSGQQQVDILEWAGDMGEDVFVQGYPPRVIELYEARLMEDLNVVTLRVAETPLGWATLRWTELRQNTTEHGPDMLRAAGAVAVGVLAAEGLKHLIVKRKPS